MKRFGTALVVLVSGLAASFALAHPVAKKFETALDCKKSSRDVLRPFCLVRASSQSEWARWVSFTPPDTLTSYGGIGVFVPSSASDKEIRTLLLEKAHPVVLHIDPMQAKVQTLTPSNEQEKQDLARLVMQVSIALKKMAITNVSIPKDMDAFFSSERKKPLYAMTTGEGTGVLSNAKMNTTLEEASFENGLHAYVVYEQAKDGVYVSLFPKLPLTKQ